jgi:hypothetical protein
VATQSTPTNALASNATFYMSAIAACLVVGESGVPGVPVTSNIQWQVVVAVAVSSVLLGFVVLKCASVLIRANKLFLFATDTVLSLVWAQFALAIDQGY